jgi:hypothetical protein
MGPDELGFIEGPVLEMIEEQEPVHVNQRALGPELRVLRLLPRLDRPDVLQHRLLLGEHQVFLPRLPLVGPDSLHPQRVPQPSSGVIICERIGV